MASVGSPALARIMIAEDERIVARDLEATLVDLGYRVVGLPETGEAVIATARELRPDLILMDIRLAGRIDGVEAATAIGAEQDIPVVFLTAHSDAETLQRAASAAPHAYLLKPFDAADLRCTIEITLHRHKIDADVRDRELRLATTLRSIGDGVVTTDGDEVITFLNPVAELLTGWTLDDAVGKKVDLVLSFRDEDGVAEIENPLRVALRGRATAVAMRSASLVGKSGAAVAIEHSASPILDGKGAVRGGVMVLRDVTERRRADAEIRRLNTELELRVAERTRELTSANHELAALSYSMAHELRSPLRAIARFSEILIEERAGGEVGDEAALLDKMRTSAQHMARLIDDMLSLARLARTTVVPRPVDLSKLANELVSELCAASPERRVEFRVHDGMHVDGDELLLRTALCHLLQNAWRYTPETLGARIEIGRERRDGQVVHFVRDNGEGFEMKYAAMIFGDFQRLDPTHQLGSTGVGLAITQRIIKRHGGQIWAEASPGAGATFYFTLRGDD